MPCTFNAREVLTYLNELGYYNITSEQLKDFMQDLKKLIKYERIQKEDIENVPPTVPYCFRPLHSIPTESSKAKQAEGRKSTISVKVRQPRQHLCSELFKNQTKFTQTSCSETDQNRSRRSKSCEPTCRSTQTKEKSNRIKTSYIIPRQPVKTQKCDPVALYRKHQEEWKKFKLPGEDPHNELRWAIRERLLGQQHRNSMSAAPSLETIARCRRTCTRV